MKSQWIVRSARLCFVAAAVGAVASPALGAVHGWNWNRPSNWGYNAGVSQGIMDAGGVFEQLSSTFDSSSNRFTFSMKLSATTSNYTSVRPAAPKMTEGFTLMMNNGPAFGNPISPGDPQKRGILAQLFVEGYNPAVDSPGSSPSAWNGVPYSGRLSAYAWNGKRIFANPWRNEDSFADGYADPTENFDTPGPIFYDAPYRLMTSVNGGVGSSQIFGVTVVSSVTTQTLAPGLFRDRYERTFSFDMDADLVKAFNPVGTTLEQPGMAWYGIGFGDGNGVMAAPDQLGIWMRTYKYVRDTVPSPDSNTPLAPDFTGATAAGVDYWDVGEMTQFGPLAPGDARIGFIRDYQPGSPVDRLGWETAGPVGTDTQFYSDALNVGFFDMFNQSTTIVPPPGAAALLGLGAHAATRRRR